MTTSTAAKYFPLIMTAFSVQRTLAGEKTQTRRIISSANSSIDGHGSTPKHFAELDWKGAFVDGGPSPAGNPGPYVHVNCRWDFHGKGGGGVRHRVYPRAQVYDRFWVRETFAHGVMDTVIYRAEATEYQEKALEWCPPIFMPRCAARIELHVLYVRAQRVQQITEHDALKEGLGPPAHSTTRWSARDEFAAGWDRLHGKGAWKRNDWVWAYTFSRIKP